MGALKLALSPNPMVKGKSARMVVRLVMIMGRMRCRPASRIASRLAIPPFRNWLILSTRMIESFTAIPTSIIMPIKAMMLKVLPRKKKVSTVPTRAKGMVSKMVYQRLELGGHHQVNQHNG